LEELTLWWGAQEREREDKDRGKWGDRGKERNEGKRAVHDDEKTAKT